MKTGWQWKRVIGTLGLATGAVVLGLTIVTASFGVTLDPVRAEPATGPEITVLATGSGEATMAATLPVSDYYLPYPGVLPDSPLYKLKAIRDKLTLWLEFDLEKKARKELLYADKRVNAAGFLLEGNKPVLAVTTATKAEKYLEQGVNRVMKLADGGKDVKSLIGEMTKACGKHLELLQMLREKTTGDNRKSIETSLAGTKLLQERLEQGLREMD